MHPNSQTIISNRFREPGILNIEPHFLQSNGLVERSIQITKRTL